jgi:hypothetical protein
MVWNLWSRKEAAYKIYNRETGIRGYFPLQIACNYDDENWFSNKRQALFYEAAHENAIKTPTTFLSR